MPDPDLPWSLDHRHRHAAGYDFAGRLRAALATAGDPRRFRCLPNHRGGLGIRVNRPFGGLVLQREDTATDHAYVVVQRN